MKKCIVLSLAVTVLLSLCSCQNTEQNNKDSEEYLKMILEVESGAYDEEKDFNHSPSIPFTKLSVDEKANKEWDATLCGKEKTLEYWETISYSIGDQKLHRYAVDKDAEESILVDEDGQIRDYLCTFDSINISKTATPEEIKPLLDTKLGKWIDVADYEYVDVPSISTYQDGRFGIYTFLYYNMIDGYMTDYAQVSVCDDGTLVALKTGGYRGDDLALNIDKDLETEMLDLKLKDIYTTEKTQYVSTKRHFRPQVVVYSGELYILYNASANFVITATGDEMSGFINNILIPLELITAK